MCAAPTKCDAHCVNYIYIKYERNYNGGRNRKKPVNREVAMEELLQVIKSTKPDKYTPKIVEKKDDYLVDDVEFWFPPGIASGVGKERMGFRRNVLKGQKHHFVLYSLIVVSHHCSQILL
uniref:Uncharacterized protein n=1 Tax=Gossypium raimondii TaxID=29730 RepID=A0A0D2R5S1_GOSRA|nr:hypothetical protein B456_004G161600 [Gossypium raimondii]